MVAAFIMSWQVALVALAAVPFLWAISAVFGRRQTIVTRGERTANADIVSAVQTALAGHETAVAYNQQMREQTRLHRHGITWLGARMSQTRIEAGFGAVMGFGQVIVTLTIAVTGVWQVRQGALSVGELLALTGYLGMLYPRMQELAEVRLSLAAAVVSADRLAELLDLTPTDQDRDHAVAHGGPDHTIAVRNVTMRRGDATVLMTCPSICPPDASSRWSGPAVRASPPSRRYCAASRTRTTAESRSAATMSGISPGTRSGTVSPSCPNYRTAF